MQKNQFGFGKTLESTGKMLFEKMCRNQPAVVAARSYWLMWFTPILKLADQG